MKVKSFTHPTELPRYRPDIDGLRALAVLAVVVFHAFPELAPGGFTGVDIFFAISGYLITGILIESLDKKTYSFTHFYNRRIKRIFPALLAVMLFCLAAGFGFSTHIFTEICKHVAGGAGFAANFVLWHEAGYFDAALATKPLMHLWSLGVEEQFYIIWPPLLYLTWRLRGNLLALSILIAAASFLWNIAETGSNMIGAFYSPLTRFWEISLGSILACAQFQKYEYVEKLRKNAIFNEILSILGIVLIAAAIFLIGKDDVYPGWRALLPTLGACLLIASGGDTHIGRGFFSQPLLAGIGLISYPLYLWHWPLLSFLRMSEGGMPSVTLRVAAVAASFFLAALTYLLIEKPIRFGSSGKTKALVLCLIMVLTGGGAYYGYQVLQEMPEHYASQLKWDYWENGSCEAKYDIRPCEANSNPPQILIMGDSQGNQLYPGFALTQPEIKTIAAGACLPLEGVMLHVAKNEEQNPCYKTNYLPVDRQILSDDPGIKTVIISARWRHILTGKIQNARERDLWGSATLISAYPEEKDKSGIELATRGLARTIRELRARGLKVALVRGTPELDGELDEYCGLMTDSPPDDCTIPEKDFLQERAGEDAMIERLRVEFPELKIYDPAEALCDGEKCYFVKGGKLYYRDNHHLSLAGSERLGRAIKTWMAREKLLP